MSDQGEGPKLHIDSDWKAEVEREREKLVEQDKKAAEQTGPAGQQMPPADFRTLMSTLVTPALLYLGGIPDPQTGQAVVSLELASHHIDLLAVLEEKTKGNLAEEEASDLASVLSELRARFVEISRHVEQMAATGQLKEAQGPAGPAMPGGMPPGPPPTGGLQTP